MSVFYTPTDDSPSISIQNQPTRLPRFLSGKASEYRLTTSKIACELMMPGARGCPRCPTHFVQTCKNA